jgi:Chaperone of endosialidase
MKTIILKKLAPVIQYFGNLTNHPPLLRRLFLIPLMLACVALCAIAQAVEPAAPDIGLAGGNTADGQNALLSLTTGTFNTAIGFDSLVVNSDTSFNTGVGAGTLLLNTANQNTAVGAGALLSNSTGEDNNAVGAFALFNNTTAFFNNAHGRQALFNNVDGGENNAFGDLAMEFNTSGASNTAIGDDALRNNVDGSFNVAVGDEAGTSIVHASNMVAIGAPGAGPFADTSNTCFIGSIFDEPVSDPGTAQAVFVDQFNVLGFLPSSKRFKHDIQPMDKASEAILALRPVIFKYNRDKKGVTQYGLIAEEVAKVNPDLVAQNKDGEILTVRYEQVNAMLLNEFLKEHKKAEEQRTNLAQLSSKMANQAAIIAEQQKGIELLTTQLKEQAAQIQKVSAQLEVSKPAAQVVSYGQ